MYFDNLSFYKNVVRFLLLTKNEAIVNSYGIPSVKILVYTFKLCKVLDLDDVQVYNYLYFFKFFFGKPAIISKYKSYFI